MLRSSNFDVGQNVVGLHKESLDMTGNSSRKDPILFDLEDEDNMAMLDQPVDDVEDYFMRQSYVKTKESAQDIDVKMGSIEVELTENIIRKFMESIVQDFP